MVQHLNDDPLTATDSTANNNDGTVYGATATNGEINGAAEFVRSNGDEIIVPDDDSLEGMDKLTVSAVVNLNSLPQNDNILVVNKHTNTYQIFIETDSEIRVIIGDGNYWQTTKYTGFFVSANNQSGSLLVVPPVSGV